MRRLERAWLLHDRGRHDEVIEFLRGHLASQPEDAEALGLLALSHAAKKQFDTAERHAREGIAHDPSLPFAHFALASVLSNRDKEVEALAEIDAAIALESASAHFHGFRAMTLLALDRRTDGLTAAEHGLALDPTNALCLNMRAHALMRLGRNRDARETLDMALAEDPDCPYSHASHGWVALQARKYDAALFHFSEALRRDPNFEWARMGLIDAMKAKHVVYRPLLAWWLFIERLDRRQRIVAVLAIWCSPKILELVGERLPALYPVAVGLLLVVLAFMFVSWFAGPLSNFLLATDPFGRAALSPLQRRVGYLVGGAVCGALVCIGLAYFDLDALAFAAALFIAGLACSGIQDCESSFDRGAAILLATLVSAGALVGAGLWLTDEHDGVGLLMIVIAFLATVFGAAIVHMLMVFRPRS